MVRGVLAAAVAVVAVQLIAPASARAGVVYQYAGNPFTYTDPVLGAPWAGGRMTALVEITNPVGGTRVGKGCSPTQPCTASLESWSISAGPWTITSNTPAVVQYTPFFVQLSADASTIDLWSLAASIPGPDPFGDFLETTFDGRAPPNNTGTIDFVFRWGGTLASSGPNNAGTWARLPALPIPEPATWALFSAALVGLGLAGMRGRRPVGLH